MNRRVRDKVVGTVMRAAALHEWYVVFDFDGKTKTISSRSLKLVADEAGVPLNEDSTQERQGNTELVSTIVFVIFLHCIDQHPYFMSFYLNLRYR